MLEQSFVVSPESFVFVVTKGKRRGKAISSQHFRNVMLEHFGSGDVSCHSLRKRGTQAWIDLGAARGAVQRQGGWKTSDTADRIYLSLHSAKTKDRLTSLAKA